MNEADLVFNIRQMDDNTEIVSMVHLEDYIYIATKYSVYRLKHGELGTTSITRVMKNDSM